MVSFPQSPGYSAASKSYYTAFEQEVRPDCYVRPNNSRDVSKVITNLKGTNPPVRLAIKGGGHAIWAGAANIEHGVTLDLSGLTGVTVDPGTKIASIGAGERWQSVYEKLGAQGLAVTGGRVASVGVSGLTLGGQFNAAPLHEDRIANKELQVVSLFSAQLKASCATMY